MDSYLIFVLTLLIVMINNVLIHKDCKLYKTGALTFASLNHFLRNIIKVDDSSARMF